jgi:hypothetical protein
MQYCFMCACLGFIIEEKVSIATRYVLAGWSENRILLGARFSAPVQTGPGTQSTSYSMGTVSFQGVGRPGRGVVHPPPN